MRAHAGQIRPCLLLLLLSLSGGALATTANLPSTTLSIDIDGDLADPAWADATQIDVFYETNPGENLPARVKTVAYLIEDGTNLYIAFNAADPEPDDIRAFLRDRDSAWDDDFVGIVLDTYNDERRAFEFFVNPLGVQMDLTNDDVNKNEDESWDAIWDSAGQITDDGFVVEMEIPLVQLRFPRVDGQQTWGMELLRFYPRDHRYRFSSNRMDRSVNCYLCQFSKLQGLESVQPGRDLEVVPTLTASNSRSTDDPGLVPLDHGKTKADAGVSIRWGISPDLTANLAINPDFSQVEADVAQLDVNSRFALFFPEKRPFFLEGADYFSTPVDAVFTRTVANPDLGTKLTGKRGDNTFGVFAAQDAITNLIFPGAFGSDSESLSQENTAIVGRYNRGFGQASSVGALLTARDGDGYQNVVGGLDMRWKISDNHDLTAQYLRSETEYPIDTAIEFEQPLDRFNGDAIALEYDYSSRHWFASIAHSRFSKGFRADSGFVPQVDVVESGIAGRRTWYGDENNWWTRINLRAEWDISHDEDGQLLQREAELYLGMGGPRQSWYQFGLLSRDIYFDGSLFKENKISFYTETKPAAGLQLGIWARYGDQVDFANTRLGDQLRIEPFLDWNATQNLYVRLRAAKVMLDSKDSATIFDAGVYDLRLTWQFSRRSFVRLTTQVQDIKRNQDEHIDDIDEQTRSLGRQLLYSYKINPQTVFFLGYSDSLFDDDEIDGLHTTDETWFMKIGYAWTP